MRERPDVDLNLIQRQLAGITEFLKKNVWKGKDADQKKTEDAGERKAIWCCDGCVCSTVRTIS
jgi:hypothetical protein